MMAAIWSLGGGIVAGGKSFTALVTAPSRCLFGADQPDEAEALNPRIHPTLCGYEVHLSNGNYSCSLRAIRTVFV